MLFILFPPIHSIIHITPISSLFQIMNINTSKSLYYTTTTPPSSHNPITTTTPHLTTQERYYSRIDDITDVTMKDADTDVIMIHRKGGSPLVRCGGKGEGMKTYFEWYIRKIVF